MRCGMNKTRRTTPAVSTDPTKTRAARGRSFIAPAGEAWTKMIRQFGTVSERRFGEWTASTERERTTSPADSSGSLGAGLAQPSSGRTRFGFQLILDDLAVERAAADVEDPCRFLLVPRNRLENPDDVRPLGFGQRRHVLARCLRRRRRRVQEFDVGGADGAARRGERRARHRALQLADVAR